ncbi:MAG: peptide chain release factor N(5)-glutamine methyltransferase [Nitrospirota bacterium]
MPTSILPTRTSQDSDSLLSWLTFGERYLQERGLTEPRREATALLFSLLSLKRIDLYRDPDLRVSEKDQAVFLEWLSRRSLHEPLQYITGEVEFCGLTFFVAPGVFIPRPETELMVELAAALNPKNILDICTGTGALAITLAKQFPSAKVTAIDCSKLALETAHLNQKRHQTNVLFLEGDLFSPCRENQDLYDLIVCNPPYIPEEDTDQMDKEVLLYEPSLALFSPDDGMAHIKKVLTDAPSFLAQNGTLMLEIGKGQSHTLLDFIKETTIFSVRVIEDLSGIDRILVCSNG